VEFSNSLFICREQNGQDGAFHPMADPFSETVIGTERVAMILQGAQSVFETEAYRPLISAVHSFARAPELPEPLLIASERVIADYLKSLYVLVADGAVADGAPPPGKDGRERIIKLLIRNVITRQIILGIESEEFLPTLVDCISRTVHNTLWATPEDKERLASYFSSELHRFLKTLRRGRRQLERLLKENDRRTLSGPQIVYLEKKWGMPHLLTAKMLREKGLVFAEAEYRESLEAWRRQPHN
jgi:alanyl-tRNA synthetase